MSLQIWFPFTHGFANQGLFDNAVTNNNVNLVETKQISGKSAYFNGDSRLVIPNTNTFLSNETKCFSIAFWAKLPTSGNYMTLFCDRTATGQGISLFWNPSELSFRFDAGGSSNGQTFIKYDKASDMPTDWTHYCFIYTPTKKIAYKNGILWKTINYTSTLSYVGSTIYIGSSASNTDTHEGNKNNFLTNTYINDYRFYNNVLTAREIKELSQRLLVHYTFFDNSIQTNLFKANDFLKTASSHSCGILQSYGINGLTFADTKNEGDAYVGSAFKNGGQYTNQFIMPVVENTQYTFSWTHIEGDETAKTYISFFNSAGQAINTDYYCIRNYSNGLSKDGTRRYHYFTTPANTRAICVRFGTGDGYGGRATIDEICIRQGDVYSYSTPGEGNIVNDNSGNGYNASLINRCQLTYDTNRGIHGLRTLGHLESAQWDKCSYILSKLGTAITPTAFTISFVAKLNAWGVQNSGILSLSMVQNAQNDYMTSTLSQYDSRFRINSTVNPYTDYSLTTNNFIKQSEWHCYSLTWNGTDLIAYCDGVNIDSITMNTQCYPFQDIYLGLNCAGGAVRDADVTWGDFKLYMTALSPEEIEKEVRVMQRILRNGTEQTILFNECNIDEMHIERTGVKSIAVISELVELNDGSCWIQVSHQFNQNKTENLFNTNDNFETEFVYHNDDCWCAFHLIKTLALKSPYEFMAVQTNDTNNSLYRFRWTQTFDPFTGDWDSAKPAAKNFIYNTNGFDTPGADNGAMYKYENVSTNEANTSFFVIANDVKSNWFGAFGAQQYWGESGIPGFNRKGTHGILDLYVRIDPDKYKKYREFKNGVSMPTTIQEI